MVIFNMKDKDLISMNRRSAITLLTCMGFTLSLPSGLMASPELVQGEIDKIIKGTNKETKKEINNKFIFTKELKC